MTCSLLHPGWLLILAGCLIPMVRGNGRVLLVLSAPLFALALVWLLPFGTSCSLSYLDYQLILINQDALSRLFITVFTLAVFAGSLFCYRQAKTVELTAAFIYAGAAISVVLAGDLISLFIFWELMALASTLVLWSAFTLGAKQAGLRYIFIHLLGGVILMCGIAAYAHQTGSVLFTQMQADSLATWLILCGFLLNAGAPPLSAWLADAYPEASMSGMIFLSAFTTKTAVYVLLRGFPGTELLIYVGLFMVFYGVIYALLENNIRKLLAYSIVSQVGFMICGIGIGTELALNGASAQAFTHIIYKALLLMVAGAVIYETGKREFSSLGGLVHTMPLTATCAIIGGLTIASFPLTSGFVSKSMIVKAASGEDLLYVWLLLKAASAGTFLYAGMKFTWLIFFQKDSGLRPSEPPVNMRAAMILMAVCCLLIGIFPNMLYAMLPYVTDYVPYKTATVVTQLQLLLFAGLAFFIVLPWIKTTRTISLDFDWLYRKLLPSAMYYLYSCFEQLQKIRENAYDKWVSRYNNAKLQPPSSLTISVSTVLCLFIIVMLFLFL